MKYRHENNRRCYKKREIKNSIKSLKMINIKNRKEVNRKQKGLRNIILRGCSPLQYAFYAILNTDLHMNRGTAAAKIAGGLITLHSILDSNQTKSQYIDYWTRNGQKIIVLKGYDHKHLKYLEKELKFIAIGTHVVRQSWGRNRLIAVLTVFGQKEDLEEVFEGLTYLR
ncbi:unnamed protein product [Xylocopa violacea]|uniref:peptidyl-tRNA hydrolase n=1 Tax=Xylocopa violacea TaxID=135666 RepID=A0ABP1NJD0_XYLVO